MPVRSLVLYLLVSRITFAQGTVPREEAGPPLSPAVAAHKFIVPQGLAIRLVVSEPRISQPLSISFDDRGRMWVLQYRQFPNPRGLKPVKVDNWLRTIYDKVPLPPPHGPKGKDRISICEDTNGDGRIDKVKHFLSDLNLASGFALGYDGVFVVQPPYLLFYPDRNRDDIPDGAPQVLLKGFGMNDAHAFANSLTWGPDGWLYGAQGSTNTANIRGIGFQQGVWRYHPLTRRFELFAEGGGNTWGIDFDGFGNLFAGGNTVEPLVHHVQGAYYVKGFGKHGPLHNPHAYGYFQPVKHHGYVGDSLTGGFVLYQGGVFPQRFSGHCIAPNTRHSASRWSKLESRGTTFATRAAGDFITTSDKWFRPVDSLVGPDGALYVADWYDYNISHSSPKNRSKWYQPSRLDGRIWRVAPPKTPAVASGKLSLDRQTSGDLVKLLDHRNAWYSRQARRILMERRDRSVVPALLQRLGSDDQRSALQALWSLHVSGGLDEDRLATLLTNKHPYVRAWTVRLLGDERKVSRRIARLLAIRAKDDPSAIVRSQLACTAKRLPGRDALAIVRHLLAHPQDRDDVHIPLLIWWAIEDKAISACGEVLSLFKQKDIWHSPIAQQTILPRLARRWLAEDSATARNSLIMLIGRAPDRSSQLRLIDGMSRALQGRSLKIPDPRFTAVLQKLRQQVGNDVRLMELEVRVAGETRAALPYIANRSHPVQRRARLIRALGETRAAGASEPLLSLLQASKASSNTIQRAVLDALGYFDSPTIGVRVLTRFATLHPNAREQALDLLCSRATWTRQLLTAIQQKSFDKKHVTLEHVRRMRLHQDKRLQTQVTQMWGRVVAQSSLLKRGRVTAIIQMLYRRPGNISRGGQLFVKHCANCHQLHGKGTKLGPDLTGAERRDRRKLVLNIVDPSAVIRPQFAKYLAVMEDGRVLTGLLADSNAKTVTIVDAKNKRTILNRADVKSLSESPGSIMPDNLLAKFTDQQIRDLIAFIRAK